MAMEIKKESAGPALEKERALLQKHTTAMNEALMLSSLHQVELREAAEELNTQLHSEIAERKKTEAVLVESESLSHLV